MLPASHASGCAWACGAQRRRSPSGLAASPARSPSISFARLAAPSPLAYGSVFLLEALIFVAAAVDRHEDCAGARREEPDRRRGTPIRAAPAGGGMTMAERHADRLRCRRCRRRSGGRDRRGGTRRARAARVLLLDREGRIKALRRRHSDKADQRIRRSRRISSPRASARRASSRRRAPASTCGSTMASSAWSTARSSTPGCASGREPPAQTCSSRRFDDAERGEDGRLAVAHHAQGRRVANCLRADDRRRRRREFRGAPHAVRQGNRARPMSLPITRSSARRAGRHAGFDPQRCDVYYQSPISPDFYGWVFPHGETTSVGVGSAVKGFDLRAATQLAARAGGAWRRRKRSARKARRCR